MLRAPVDEFGEHLPGGQAVGIVQLAATFGADTSATVFQRKVLKVLWHTEKHADHAQRHDCAEILDEVEPIPAHERVEATCCEFADQRFEGIDLPRYERPGEQIPMDVVDRGIFEDQGAGGISMPDLRISNTTPLAELKVS